MFIRTKNGPRLLGVCFIGGKQCLIHNKFARASRKRDANAHAITCLNFVHGARPHMHAGARHNALHFGGICVLVTLRARTPHRWPLGRIEHAKLNARMIGCLRHDSAKRVNFPHHLSLGKTANRRIATHGTNAGWIHGD